jgi:hypothetical protein
MELVVALVHPSHRLLFEVLAATGARRSELLALEGRHLALDGDRPHVKIRQRVRRRRGEGLVVGPLKSRHAKRDVPIPLVLADRLRALDIAANALVFQSSVGTVLDPDNLAERVLAPACAEAGVEWAGFHTFPAHRRVATFRCRTQPGSGPALARSPFGELHARHVCAPARQRPWRPADARARRTLGVSSDRLRTRIVQPRRRSQPATATPRGIGGCRAAGLVRP